jgi:glyoxalase family protein
MNNRIAWREKIVGLGYSVSPVMDRTFFALDLLSRAGWRAFRDCDRSSGVHQDEAVDELGSHLRLPPWLEQARPRIEEILPNITLPIETTV